MLSLFGKIMIKVFSFSYFLDALVKKFSSAGDDQVAFRRYQDEFESIG